MIWLFLASLASGEEPTDGPAIDVAGGAGFFSPLNRPWQVNPTLDGQADITQVVPGVPGLGASAGAQLGAWFPWGCGSSCGTQGVWRLGAGPTYATPFVDVSLLLRLVGFGSSVDVKPALQGTAKVDIDGPLELRPYVAVEGVRYPDLNIGLRVATRVTDRTQTRARQCEDGDTRTLDQPVQQVSYRWISELTPESIAWDYGEAYAGELDNPMGKMKGLLSDVLAISGSAQSARALGKGEAGVSDYVGRMQDVGSSYDGLDWSLPATPADLPTALANNYMEIGKRAIDALLPKLEEHRNRHLFGVNLTYHYEVANYECVPTQVCVDGWWEDAGWEPSGPPAMDQIGPRTHTILNPGEGSQRAQLRAMWRRIGNWYRQRDGGKQETFDEASNICVIGDTFSSEVDVADGPSQDDCERWLAERAGLDSERRALVGSSLDLYEDQLEWAEGQTRQDCEDAQRSAEFWSESAAKQAEIAALSGDGTAADMAVEATKRSEEYARKAERDCDWADKVGDKRQEIADRVDNRPERLEEIEAEKAELDAKIAECDLIE